MGVIQRADESRLTIEEAKSLISGALPYERGVDVYMHVNADGQIDFDGPIEVIDEGSNIFAGGQLATAFKEASMQGLITPRFKYRPTVTSYTGSGDDDANYTISHADFVAIAGLYGISVEVDAAPQFVTHDVAPVPLALATGDIAFCFDGIRWSEKQWRKPLGDKPKWLRACIVIPGVQGVSETRWNPVLIGAAMVQNGYVSARSVRARFQSKPQLAPWLDAWKTYEADYFDNE